MAFRRKISAPLGRFKGRRDDFLSGKNSPLEAFFMTRKRLSKLCYLADIFEKLNDLNISMQGENSNG